MDKLNKMTKVAYSLSAGVLASTLALSAFNHQVHAEEALNKAEILEKLEELEEHVYTIAEADHEDASANFSENEEMKAVKKLLVEALTKAIGEDFKKLIDVEKTSVEVFEQLFNLVTSLLEEEYPVAIDFEKMTILSHEDNNEEKLTIDTDAQKLLNDNELKEHVAIDANLKDQSVEIESVENTQESVTEVSHNDHVEEVDEVVEESTVTHVDSSNETTSKEEVVVDESHDENIKEIDHKEEITQKDTKSEQKAAPEVKKEVKTVAAAKSASPLMVARTSSRASTYVVQPGDTLNAISRKFDVSVGTLAKLNNIQNINIIYVGQVLRLNGSVTPSNSSTIQITTRDQFISTVGEHARQVANKNGLYASVMVAQAALESGFGQSTLSKAPNYNLFGIKGNYNGQSVTMKTSEWSSSNGWYQVNADFRKYPSYAESLQDNANVLRNGPSWDPNYYKGAWRENANSYLDATQWLQGRYATDPSYASKLNNIISMYNLTRFDTISENTSHTQTSDQVSKPSTKPAPQAKPSPSAPSTSSNTYTVVSGDTLSQIAQKFGTTVAAIAKENGIANPNIIRVGQKLVISSGQVSKPSTKPAPQSKPAPSTPSTSSNTYTVVSGDTLSQIAQKFGTTVAAIAKENGIANPNIIRVGQKLVISGNSASKPSTKPTPQSKPAPSTPSTSSNTYTVVSGDTLSQIAQKFGTTVAAIAKENGIANPNIIRVGQKLVISGNSASKPSAKSAPANKIVVKNSHYTVKAGDTLSGIAYRHGVSLANLVRWNNIRNANLIHIGQQIIIGQSQSTVQSSAPVQKSASSSTGKTHTVVSGDTLWALAKKYNTTVQQLQTKNRLNSSLIIVGQRLYI